MNWALVEYVYVAYYYRDGMTKKVCCRLLCDALHPMQFGYNDRRVSLYWMLYFSPTGMLWAHPFERGERRQIAGKRATGLCFEPEMPAPPNIITTWRSLDNHGSLAACRGVIVPILPKPRWMISTTTTVCFLGQASTKLNAEVYGIINRIPIKFPLPNPDGCVNSGLKCPLVAGQSYVYQDQLAIQHIYPSVGVFCPKVLVWLVVG